MSTAETLIESLFLLDTMCTYIMCFCEYNRGEVAIPQGIIDEMSQKYMLW